jgi:hypothetical protein
LPSISWSTSWSFWSQIHIHYSFGNSISFHSLYICPNQHNLYNLIVSVMVGFLTITYISFIS